MRRLLAGLLVAGLCRAAAPNASQPLRMPVPPEGSEWVHPSVAAPAGGWRGFAYWMAATPYAHSDEATENPCVVVSQDGSTWTTPPGLVNPLVPRPRQARRYNSDPHLQVTPDDRLLLTYRVAGDGRNDELWMLWTRDGRAWSRPKRVLDAPLEDERLVSPALVRVAAGWWLYTVDTAAYPYQVRRRTAAQPEGPWSAPEPVVGLEPPPGRMVWHLDAFQDGGRTVLLLDCTEVYRTQAGGQLVFASSVDGRVFRQAAAPVLTGSMGWDRSIYRACCLPERKGDRVTYRIWYSAWGPDLGWQLGQTVADAAPPDPAPAQP